VNLNNPEFASMQLNYKESMKANIDSISTLTKLSLQDSEHINHSADELMIVAKQLKIILNQFDISNTV